MYLCYVGPACFGVEFAITCDREAIYYDFLKYYGLLPHIRVMYADALAIVKSLSDHQRVRIER
jgi:hypothetical protein